jgi:hypothetical protein
MKRLAIMSGLAAVVAVTGCSAREPARADLAQAELAVERAAGSKAPQYAPLELRKSREKVEAARTALDDGDEQEAQFLAEQALVDARLAEAKAESQATQELARQTQRTIEALRTEAGGTTTPPSAR